jgi:hypothetical protein
MVNRGGKDASGILVVCLGANTLMTIAFRIMRMVFCKLKKLRARNLFTSEIHGVKANGRVDGAINHHYGLIL